MGLLGPLAGLLGIETEVLLQRFRESAVAYAAIGLFSLITIVFLLIAAYTALDERVGPIWAPLIIALVALVIALVLYVALRIQTAALRRREAERRVETESTALLASAAVSALPELLNSSLVRNVGLPLAAYAAFMILRRPRKGNREEGERRS
ncbi:MAG TPA: hypothetical protein VL418_18530 [Devosiaceae bacterium]|nr:hypothetical protein [Devosiaceae bacterium]